MAGEVGRRAGVVRLHRSVPLLPVHGADFAVLFKVLQGIDHAQGFRDGAPQGHVVDHLVLDHAFAIDEEEPAIGHQFAFDTEIAVIIDVIFSGKNAVGIGDGLVRVRDERVLNALDTALIAWDLFWRRTWL